MEQKYNLEFSKTELAIIAECLATGAYHKVAPVIQTIQVQIAQQEQAEAAKEVKLEPKKSTRRTKK